MYGEGISKEGGLLDVGVAMDVVSKTGAWFNFGETRLGQGREASKDFLKANPDIAAEIERRIRGKITEVADPGRGHRRGRVGRRDGRAALAPRDVLSALAPERSRSAGGRGRRRPAGRPRGRRCAVPRRRARGPSRRERPVGESGAARAGYRPDLVDGAIARLTELGMLDDEAFARAWVESRDRARPRGERAIREELRLKGIDRAIVDLVLEERRDAAAGPDADGVSADPRSGGRRAAARQAPRALARVADPRQRRQRAYALLARNGFDPETCREVAATVVTAPEADVIE